MDCLDFSAPIPHSFSSVVSSCAFPPFVLTCVCAQGIIAYHRGDYETALNTFTDALRRHPDIDATVRIAIGMCFFQLKQFTKAQQAFERAIALVRVSSLFIAALVFPFICKSLFLF